MYKIELSNAIIEKHAQYIVKRGTRDKIVNFMNDKKYEAEILKRKNAEFLTEHKAFMKELVEAVDEIKTYDYKTMNRELFEKNVFLASPKSLSNFIKEFEEAYPVITSSLFTEEEFIVEYRKDMIYILGYNDFIGNYNINLDYKVEKLFNIFNSLNKIDLYMKQNKKNKDTRQYEKEDYYNIINFYVEKIESTIELESEYNEDIKIILGLKRSMEELKTMNLNKSDFIRSMYDAIENSEKEYLSKRDGEYIDIKKYWEYSIYKDNEWSAYHYVFEIGLKTCPYCNRQYITPIYTEDGKVRGDIDHFFSKSKYPYLSMSIYNLVPCCRFCNSSLKLDKEFTYNDNINPFEYGISDILEFDFIPKSYSSFYGFDDIIISLKEKKQVDKELVNKAKNNCEIFKIKELYNYHSDIVKKIILKRMIYSDQYLDKLCENYSRLIKSREEAIQFLLQHNLEHDDLDNPLNVLLKDIIKWIKFY